MTAWGRATGGGFSQWASSHHIRAAAQRRCTRLVAVTVTVAPVTGDWWRATTRCHAVGSPERLPVRLVLIVIVVFVVVPTTCHLLLCHRFDLAEELLDLVGFRFFVCVDIGRRQERLAWLAQSPGLQVGICRRAAHEPPRALVVEEGHAAAAPAVEALKELEIL